MNPLCNGIYLYLIFPAGDGVVGEDLGKRQCQAVLVELLTRRAPAVETCESEETLIQQTSTAAGLGLPGLLTFPTESYGGLEELLEFAVRQDRYDPARLVDHLIQLRQLLQRELRLSIGVNILIRHLTFIMLYIIFPVSILDTPERRVEIGRVGSQGEWRKAKRGGARESGERESRVYKGSGERGRVKRRWVERGKDEWGGG